MLGLRQKLSLGFGGLLAILLLFGVYSIIKITELGRSIDVILRENYRSVIACQDIKEALERIDSGTLFILLGFEKEGTELIDENLAWLRKSLRIEGNNITLAGEGEVFRALEESFEQYASTLMAFQNDEQPFETRRGVYFEQLLPLFHTMKDSAERILQMNQTNMSDANAAAREKAANARQRMYLLLLSGFLLAFLFLMLTGKWILRPITTLTRSADAIRQGNLDLVVPDQAKDEIGHLSRAFNAMAASLREYRRSSDAKYLRIQHATQQAFGNLPEAIAVIDLDGRVEVATGVAGEIFSLKPGIMLRDIPCAWLMTLCDESIRTGRPVEGTNEQAVIQRFTQGEERFFCPKAIPILDERTQPTGSILMLTDVTQLRQQDELKRGLISTVSHQLKSPLTSIRMAIYVLLEEKIGPLVPKQQELLLAAREDSERLYGIIEDLLDINRMQSGRTPLEFQAATPQSLVADAIARFESAAQDAGLTIAQNIPAALPDVLVDTTRINHVFANIISNALKYTPPGGSVTCSANADTDFVWFSVSDTGIGIPPEHLPRVFDQFFRVPGQGNTGGAGLGLAIAKEIVEVHGGTIQVESVEGKGSAFIFSLRRAQNDSKG